MSQRRLGVRISIGSLLVAVVVGITLADARDGAFRFAPLVAGAVGLVALLEYLKICARAITPKMRWSVIVAGSILMFWRSAAELAGIERVSGDVFEVILGMCGAIPLVVTVLARRTSAVEPLDFESVAAATFGLFLVAYPMAALNEICFIGETVRYPLGRTWVLLGFSGFTPGTGIGSWLLVVTLLASKLNDIGGYLVGSALGRHKLAPGVSPNKSVEGALAGLFLGTLWSYAAFSWFGPVRGMLTPGHAAVFGVVIAVTTQLGDLAESMIKRAVGVKDSAAVLPAFGGMLDLVDSFILSAPTGYTLLLFWLR